MTHERAEQSRAMSSVETFFRHCPACGRQFEIRLVRKKLEDIHQDQETIRRSMMTPGMNLMLSQPIVVDWTYMV